MKLTVRIWPDDIDGGYVAQCVELPGAISQGDTEAEALTNVAEAIEGMLAVMVEDAADAPVELREGTERQLDLAVRAA